MKRRLFALAAIAFASFASPSAVADDVSWEFKRNFIGWATALGFVIDSGEAAAYFKGEHYQQSCFARGDMIACQLLGPMNVLFVYDQQSEYVEMTPHQSGFCYAGREGVFCDIYSYAAASPDAGSGKEKTDEDQSDRPAPPDLERIFDLPPGPAQILFDENRNAQRCMTGKESKMCSVTGPVTVQLKFKEFKKTYDFKAGEYGICYAGRVKVFCDIRAGASVGE